MMKRFKEWRQHRKARRLARKNGPWVSVKELFDSAADALDVW